MKNLTHRTTGKRNGRPATSEWWAGHFRRDLQRDWTIPWNCDAALSTAEHQRIATSVAEFQRGESSQAPSYLAKSARFGDRVGDAAFHSVSKLFIEAENVHADLLLRFMQQTGIPIRRRSSRDVVFRWLRRLSDLGWSSRVILLAEIIAQEYYPCLRSATTHPVLTRICDRIISEETAHIRFQVERIVGIETAHRRTWSKLRDIVQAGLMGGTACVVYAGHHRVLSVRMGFREFIQRVYARQQRAIAAMRALRQHKDKTGIWRASDLRITSRFAG